MDKSQGKKLLSIAREAISKELEGKELKADEGIIRAFSEKQGVFVTLTINDELRGCIGFPEPVMELWKAVIEAAKSAAFSDPRFEPLTAEEWKQTGIELSVLTKPELIKAEPSQYPGRIRIGKDGLIIRSAYGAGLLLPQVFREHKVNALQALEMTCQKAGLAHGCWKEEGVRVYRFQAEIFHEERG